MTSLIEIFYSPAKVFDRVRERGLFLPAFIGVMLMAMASAAVVINLIGMETIVRKQLESNPRVAEQMGQDGIDKAVQAANSPGRKAIGYVAPLIGAAVVLLVVGGLLLGALTLLGAKLNYLQVLGTTAYSWFPFSVVIFIMSTLIVSLAPDRTELNYQSLLATNVAAFLDKATTNKVLYSIAGSLDIIAFAQMAFLGWGLSRVSRLPLSKCLIAVVGLWLIFVLCKAGFAAI